MFVAVSGITGTLAAVSSFLLRVGQKNLVAIYGSVRRGNFKEFKFTKLFSKQGVSLGKLGHARLRHDGQEHQLECAATLDSRGSLIICMQHAYK
jgi:type IV secretory pathway TraG/TraD family ATPase VirD4